MSVLKFQESRNSIKVSDPVPAQLPDLLGEREEEFVLERLVVAHDLDDDGQVVDARGVPHA